MKNNYILVDYENVQNIDLTCLKEKTFFIKIFIGTNQTKVPIDLVLKSQELGNQVEWIQINGSGKNALDFHITFVLGRLVQKDPDACFHIISKDTGFDPLVIYLKNQKILCSRKEEIALITSLLWNEKTSPEDTCTIIVQKLASIDKKGRPKSESTLKNYIKAQLGLKEVTPVIDAVYQNLISSKKIYFDQSKKIDYSF
ncbi:PIN domain-containing protein [Pseudanabaena minima]|uniref:PIN domain-containing protein n=1 Tax=Pseudanabaena minima TaxID=890415 RepID=UPI003DA7DFF3